MIQFHWILNFTIIKNGYMNAFKNLNGLASKLYANFWICLRGGLLREKVMQFLLWTVVDHWLWFICIFMRPCLINWTRFTMFFREIVFLMGEIFHQIKHQRIRFSYNFFWSLQILLMKEKTLCFLPVTRKLSVLCTKSVKFQRKVTDSSQLSHF